MREKKKKYNLCQWFIVEICLESLEKVIAFLWPSVGNIEEAARTCEHVERVGMNRPKPS